MTSPRRPRPPQAPAEVEQVTGRVLPPDDPYPEPDGDSGPEDGDRAGREPIALVDLLDRVLAGGVVVAGEVTLSVADVDMVTISVRALVTSVSALAAGRPADGSPGQW